LLISLWLLPALGLRADVTLTDKAVTQKEIAKKKHLLRQRGPGDTAPSNGVFGGATGSRRLVDGDGLEWSLNSDITFSTTSSCSGAMSEAGYTHAVAASTLAGGTTMSALNDAFDGYNSLALSLNNSFAQPQAGNANFVFYNRNGPATVDSSCAGRQIILPVRNAAGITMQRKVYVPADDGFCRWLNIFTNTTGAPVTLTAMISNNLGSDSNTQVTATASGDLTADVSDEWVATFQNYSGSKSSDVRLGHVLRGVGAPVGLAGIHFANGDDNPYWGYTMTLAAGETGIIMNFATGKPSKAAAAAKAAELALLPPGALACMSLTELSQLKNFSPGYRVQFQTDDEGTLSGDIDQTVWGGGSSTPVRAIPDKGYRFEMWTEVAAAAGVASPSGVLFKSYRNPLTIDNVLRPMVVRAHYVRDSYTITFKAGAGGTLAGTTVQTVMAGGYATPVTAVPDRGYHLLHWTGCNGLNATTNPLVVGPVNADITVMASFANAAPTVRIVSPAAGATVHGLVKIQAVGSDEDTLAQVTWRVDDQPIPAAAIVTKQGEQPLTCIWESASWGNGVHTLRVTATDPAGLQASDAVQISLRNLGITLTGQWSTLRVWIVSRPEVSLQWQASDTSGRGLARFQVWRQTGGGAPAKIAEVGIGAGAEAVSTYDDRTVVRGTSYQFWIVATDSAGTVLGNSAKITL